ncbi:Formylglycine-generating enzyme [Purpureocillium takamizusanense]|uniref:Formylglycine-generating enzyme n=1 Tax=Purpureocillium takamizusanense TaxID=2060973 RepID=A0A9Q8QJZ2_9HYPO|nr:Formylglycine-generating enzyme [Purpureocillium takamizusanense]UNI22449.1 Formylglycine-generating enzyme [Purpureocillium takamizusanense]
MMRVSALALLTLSVAGSAVAAAPDIRQLEAQLYQLSETLRWNGTTHATYAHVEPAARAAHSTLAAIAGSDPEAVPQAALFADALARLVAESHYLTELSRARDYQAGVLDSAMFLIGSVNEWHYTVNLMGDKLRQPSSYREPPPGRSKAGDISKATKPGTEFCDHDAGPTMVVIPTGTYTAGSDHEEQEHWKVPVNRRQYELPHRQVHIATPLAFSRTEITVRQFEAFLRDTDYEPRGGARWWDPADPGAMVFNPSLGWSDPGFPQTPDSPVVAVTRQDAKAYARWLSVITGQTYRLPSEDEWEWAARGGSNDSFFWGHDLDHVNLYANSYDQTARAANNFTWVATNVTDGFPYTAPVASFRPNAFGLYDVTANAREFMADSWVPDLARSPNNGSVHPDPVAPFPVVRGGAWNYQPQNLRLNYRTAYFSSEVATNMFGIRLVRELT